MISIISFLLLISSIVLFFVLDTRIRSFNILWLIPAIITLLNTIGILIANNISMDFNSNLPAITLIITFIINVVMHFYFILSSINNRAFLTIYLLAHSAIMIPLYFVLLMKITHQSL